MKIKYDVIDTEECRGQSVTENGIPCTARHWVTQLNMLSQENEKLIKKVKASNEIIDELMRSINCSLIKENRNLMTKLHNINKLLNDLYEGIDEHYTETLENNDELAVVRAETELKLITKILEEVEKI